MQNVMQKKGLIAIMALVLVLLIVVSVVPIGEIFAAQYAHTGTVSGKQHALYKSDGTSLSSYRPSEINLYTIDGGPAYCVECGVDVGGSYDLAGTLAEACAAGQLKTAAGGGGYVASSSTKAEKWFAYVSYFAPTLSQADRAMGIWMALGEATPVAASYSGYDSFIAVWNAFEAWLPNAGYFGSTTKLYKVNSTKQALCVFTPFDNTPKTGNITIVKSSSCDGISNGNENYSLAGAKFNVYNSANAVIGTLVTDASGKTDTISNLNAGGGYYVMETEAPKGFSFDATKKYPFNITASQTVTVNVSDAPINDPIAMLVKKIDADTCKPIPQGDASLENTEFTVKFYAIDASKTYTQEELEAMTATRTWVFKTDEDGFANYHADYLVSGGALYVDQNGLNTLPLGVVTVQETKEPEGYLLPDPAPMSIQNIVAPDQQLPTVEAFNTYEAEDEVITGKLCIVKTLGSDTVATEPSGADTMEAGAEFDVILKSSDEVVDHIVTNDKGIA